MNNFTTKTIAEETGLITTSVSDPLDIRPYKVGEVHAQWVDQTPTAKNFIAGTAEVATVTFDTVANSTNGDYLVVEDTTGDKWAVSLSKAGIAEVTEITCLGDVAAVAEVTSVTAIGEGSVKNVTSVTTVADVSASLAGTYFKAYDASGSVGVWFSISSVPATPPTGAAACDRAVEVALASDDTAAQVAGKITTAFGADGGLVVGNSDEAVTITDAAYGVRTEAADGEAGDATGFTITTSVAGVASVIDGKYFTLPVPTGTAGVWFDISGSTAEPAGVGVLDASIEITTVSEGDDADTVAAAVAAVLDALPAFGASATGPVITVTQADAGAVTDGADVDSGFTISVTQQGSDAVSLDGKYFVLQDVAGSVAFWIDVDNSGTTAPAHGADRAIEITTISTGDDAATVAGLIETAIHADSKFTASSADTVVTVTNVDLKTLTDAADGDTGFTFETTTQGADLCAEPTGAIWTAIAAGKKVQADISADTTAADVAARVETAIDALTGFTAKIVTNDDAADGTMLFTQTAFGLATNPVVKSADDSGAGSISAEVTAAGVISTVDVTANTITIASHGFSTGLKGQLTTTGTLPAGLATSTDYFVIVVDANTIKLASSLVNATAGTAIDITDQGASGNTHTFTATAVAGASVTFQKSLDNLLWIDIQAATAITGSSNVAVPLTSIGYNYIRTSFTCTAGQVDLTVKIAAKE